MSEQVSASDPMYRASRDDDQGLKPSTMRLLYVAGGAGIALLAGVGIYSLTGRTGGDVPIVQADGRPMREKPANAGGMQVAAEEKRTDPNQSRLAPGAEEPNPRGLLSIPDAARGQGPAAPAAARPAGKSVTVQLTSAKSEADAQAAWDRLAKKMPDLVGQRRPLFQKVSEQGQTPWRLRTGGFADQSQARAFCGQVKAKGGKCVVVES